MKKHEASKVFQGLGYPKGLSDKMAGIRPASQPDTTARLAETFQRIGLSPEAAQAAATGERPLDLSESETADVAALDENGRRVYNALRSVGDSHAAAIVAAKGVA